MQFDLSKSLEILERTPGVLQALLGGLSEEWVSVNEGPETWSPYDIVGHLLHGEKTDWIQRMDIILNGNNDGHFVPFDRFAQFHESAGKSLQDLLTQFAKARAENINTLKSRNIQESDLDRVGIHPTFGTVTLRQLLSTWTAHDLDHLAQISRVMAKQYKEATGPWIEFLRILRT